MKIDNHWRYYLWIIERIMYRGEVGQKESGNMKRKASLGGKQISIVDDINISVKHGTGIG